VHVIIYIDTGMCYQKSLETAVLEKDSTDLCCMFSGKNFQITWFWSESRDKMKDIILPPFMEGENTQNTALNVVTEFLFLSSQIFKSNYNITNT
jgi:hypothetical protein